MTSGDDQRDAPPLAPDQEITLPADHGTRHRAARNVTAAGLAEVVGKLSTLVWTVVAARELGQAGFGAFAFALAFAQLVAVVPEWGTDRVLVRRSAGDPARTPSWYSATVVSKLLAAGPVYLVLVAPVVLLRGSEDGGYTLLLLSMALIADMWSHSIRSTGAALQRQAAVAGAVSVQRIVTAVLAIAVLQLGGGVIALASGFLAGSVIGLLVHVAALRRLGVRLEVRRVDRALLRDLWRESRAIGLAAVVLMALFRIDTVLLGVLTDEEAVAAYSVSYRLFETVLFLTYSVNAVLFALMSTATETARIARTYGRGAMVAAFLYLPFAAVCLVEAESVLGLLYGAGYAEQASGALRWLGFAPLVYALCYFGNSVAFALGRRGAALAAASAALGVTVVLDLLLLPRYEGTGAAAVTLLGYAVDFGVLVYVLRTVITLAAVVRALVDPAIAAVALAGALVVLDLPVVTELVIGAVTYVAVWLGVARLIAPAHVDLVLAVLPGRSRR